LITPVGTLAQEPQDVAATEGGDGAADKLWVDPGQGVGRRECRVGGPLRLEGRPVIRHPQSTKHPPVRGIQSSGHHVEHSWPVDLVHAVHDRLGLGEIVDPVVVEELALAHSGLQFKHLFVPVTVDLVGPFPGLRI